MGEWLDPRDQVRSAMNDHRYESGTDVSQREVITFVNKSSWDDSYLKARSNYFQDDLSPLDRPGCRVLDVGGGKYPWKYVTVEKAQVSIINIDPVMLLADRDNQRQFHHILGDGMKLPFKDGSFDIIFSGDMYEHLPRDNSVLLEWRRVLKPGGLLVIATPNLDRLTFRFGRMFRRFTVERMRFPDDSEGEHGNEVSLPQLIGQLESGRFKVTRYLGLSFHLPFTIPFVYTLPRLSRPLGDRYNDLFMKLGKNLPSVSGQIYVVARR